MTSDPSLRGQIANQSPGFHLEVHNRKVVEDTPDARRSAKDKEMLPAASGKIFTSTAFDLGLNLSAADVPKHTSIGDSSDIATFGLAPWLVYRIDQRESGFYL
jgi:hypothetical protein